MTPYIKILMEIVASRIDDQVILDLIRKAIKVGYINFNNINMLSQVEDNININSNISLSISSLLYNVMLHKLDEKIIEFKAEFYQSISDDYTYINNDVLSLPLIETNNTYKYRKLVYIRYDNKFLIGVFGSYRDCIDLRNKISGYLTKNLNLDTSTFKISICHANTTSINFLSTNIRIMQSSTLSKSKFYKNRNIVHRVNNINTTSRPVFFAPIQDIVKNLVNKGYAKKGRLGKPTRMGKLIHLELADIIDHYNSLAQEILNYYSFTNN